MAVTGPGIAAAAGTPSILTYQGRLANSSGDLLGGTSGTTYYFKFSIWTSPTVGQGTRVWPASAPTAVSSLVRQGVFTVNIGDTANGYPDTLDYEFSNPNVYLQVEVSSDNASFETLSPRHQLTSSVFAQMAAAVVSASSTITTLTNTNFNGIYSTTTAATTTNLFASVASSTNLFSTTATFANLFANTANLTESGNLFWTQTRFDIALAGTTTLNGLTTLLGLGDLISARATTTNATTTNFYITGKLAGAGLSNCDSVTEKLIWSNGVFTCGTDSGSSGSGITAFGAQFSSAQTGATQTLATTTDDNLVLTITSSGNTHTFAPSWTGTLAAGRGGTGTNNPSAAGILLGSYAGGGWQQLATSSLGLLTTNVAEGTNQYFTDERVQTYLDSIAKGYFFSTTSASHFVDASTTIPKTYSDNTFSGANTFSSLITGSISGNAGTVTNGVYTTTFNGLFDARFDTNLAGTTTLNNLAVLLGITDIVATRATTTQATSTNLFATSATFTSLFGSTANLTESGNLFYTDARADARINATSTLGTLQYLPNLVRSTTTSATSTSFFATTASSTNLFAAAAQLGTLTVANTISGSISGNAGTASALQSARTINGTSFDGTQNITITAASSTLLADNNTFSGNNTFSNTITGSVSGSAGSAATLTTARNINGTSFDGSADITITAASSTLLANNNTFSGTNSFTNLLSLSNLLLSGSSTLQNFTGVNATTTQATTTRLAITGISNNSILKVATAGSVIPAVAGTDYLAAALTSLGAQFSSAQTGATQTLATTTDDNLVLTITSSGNTHTFTPSWTGTLAVSRGGTGISNPTAAGILLGSYAGGGWQQLATSSLGLLTTNVAEGTNQYFTDARADARINATTTLGTLSYLPNLLRSTTTAATSTNLFSTSANFTNLCIGGDCKSAWPTTATAASSTLLADDNTFSGANTFSSLITGSISGNAGTVTNGVYTTTFNGLFDTRFDTNLIATTTLNNLTTLKGLTDVIATRATTTSATSTSFFATTASSTNLFAAAAQLGTLTVANTISGSISGNAGTASALQSARTINGTSFDGTQNITITAASSTILANNNTFSGANTFSSLITGSISGNAGTVTNGVYTTTFNGLFDTRFDTNLIATTTLNNLTTLKGLTDLIATRATTTSATSTNLFATTASTTNFFGAGLVTCQAGSVLTYDGSGKFGCATDQTGGGGANSKFATSTNGVAIYPNSAAAVVIGATATTTTGAELEVQGDLYVSGSSTLQRLTAVTSTTTQATTTNFAISGIASSLLKTNSIGSLVAAVSGTDYEAGLTAGDGLTRTVNDFDCDIASSSVFGCLLAADWTNFNNKVSTTSIDTIGEVETLWGVSNILVEADIDASSELLALFDDETGTGNIVFSTIPTLQGFLSTASSTIVGNLTITGNSTTTAATSTSLFATSANFNTLCIQLDCKTAWPTGGSGAPFAWTPQSWGVSTTTTIGLFNGFLSTASSTFTGGFIANRSTTTAATTTNFFADVASSTNLFSTTFKTGSINANSLYLDEFAANNGFLRVSFGAVVANDFPLSADQGGTGTAYTPTYGQLLVGNEFGSYSITATSSLGLLSPSDLYSTTTLNNLTTLKGLTDVIATRATTTSATSTSFFATTASSTNLFATSIAAGNISSSGTLTSSQLLVTSSTTLQNFTGLRSTTTNATTTSLYVSGMASTTNLNANNVVIGTLTVGSCTGCGSGGDAGFGVEAVRVHTANGTWTKPAYVNNVYVQVWGGGAGGGVAGANASDGGGGSGGYSAGVISVSGNVTVTVGATSGAGGAGNNSSFPGGATVAGNGGSTNSGVTGGAGGTASGGTINITGAAGGSTLAVDGAAGGDGGSAPFGGSGGMGGTAVATGGTGIAGQAGSVPGGGGGGGAESGGAASTGGAGLVIVWELSGTNGSDLAEFYETKPDVGPGDVVSISSDSIEYESEWGLQKISVLEKAKPGSRVVGVVSTAPHTVMGRSLEESGNSSNAQPIALAGRTPVKVSLENGPIKAGDILVPASEPGYAAKMLKDGGTIIGAALEDYESPLDGSAGTLMMFIDTSYSTGARTNALLERAGFSVNEIPTGLDIGRIMLAQLLVEKKNITATSTLAEIFTDRVVAGLEVISPRVITDTLVVSAIEPVESKVRLKLTDGGRFVIERVATSSLSFTFGETEGAVGEEVVSIDELGNAFFAGGLTGASLEIGSVEKPGGVTLYDTVTGKPYCTTVTNGALVTTQGKCGNQAPPPMLAEPSGTQSGAGEDDVPEPIVQPAPEEAIGTTSPQTSTDAASDNPTEPSSPPTPDATSAVDPVAEPAIGESSTESQVDPSISLPQEGGQEPAPEQPAEPISEAQSG